MKKLVNTLALGLVLTIASTAIAAAKCPGEAGKRSKNGDVSTSIKFRVIGENDETQFKVYWLDYNGHRVLYKHAFAGDTWTQQTFMTHPWLITAPVPGGGEDCIGVYMPKRGGRTITLR